MALNERELLKMKKLLQEVNALRAEFGKQAYKVVDDTSVTLDDVRKIRQEIEYLRDVSGEVNNTFGGVGDIIKDIKREFQAQNNLVKEGLASYKRLQGIAEKFKMDMLGIQKMEKKQIEQNITGIRKEFVARQENMLFQINTKITSTQCQAWFTIQKSEKDKQGPYRYKYVGSILDGLVQYFKMVKHLKGKENG